MLLSLLIIGLASLSRLFIDSATELIVSAILAGIGIALIVLLGLGVVQRDERGGFVVVAAPGVARQFVGLGVTGVEQGLHGAVEGFNGGGGGRNVGNGVGEHGLHAVALKPRDYADRAAHDEALFSAVADVQPDLIVCAGYLRIISDATVRRFEDRMINLHPSLLPRHPGLDTHARVLAAGETEHGASVHAVIPALDAGPVLAQVRLDVAAGDTADDLARRLSPREHALLVACTAAIAGGRARLAGGLWLFDGQVLDQPLRLDNHDQLQRETAHA